MADTRERSPINAAMHRREETVQRPRLTLVDLPQSAAPRTTAPTRPASRLRSRSARFTLDATATVRARLATVTDDCWQCRSKVRGVVGVIVDPQHTPDGTGFLPFDDVAEGLAEVLDPRTLDARRIGDLRHRDSPGVPGGYLSNGCAECDALIGRFRLEDLLTEHLQNGGTYAQLDIGVVVDLPLEAQPVRLTALG